MVSIAKLRLVKAKRVLGVDASTNSIAFCIFENDKPVSYGEIKFEGGDVYERMLDAKRKIHALKAAGLLKADFMAIEAGVVVKSTHIGIKMAYVFGVIMAEILEDNMKVLEVHPISWQSAIGNKNFTKVEKEAVRIEFPGKSENWYKAKIRDIRKHRTLDFANNLGIKTDSDNVADSAGIAYYAYHNLAGL
jgi:Holliday junction resolvasome RuvABC endonuclease subunit